MDFEQPKRLRINGTARIIQDEPLRSEYPGCVFVVRVNADRIFPNCLRYIHKMQVFERSTYALRFDYTPPTPAWKSYEVFRDALSARDCTVDSEE